MATQTPSDVQTALTNSSLMSFAESAIKNRYSSPKMTEKNILDIKRGRNPLQELCIDTFVPNGCRLTGGSNAVGAGSEAGGQSEKFASIVLLTGPDHSGKTVYVKQVALITYMAHLGSFVPAESAVIGITDKIITCLQTKESAFMVFLSNPPVLEVSN